MEADFVRYYNLDLAAEVNGGSSLRRLVVLLEGLPDEAAIWREEMRWTTKDELQALTIEVIDMQRREAFMIATGKQHPSEPIKIPRPWDEEEKKAEPKKLETNAEVIGAWFGKWLA